MPVLLVRAWGCWGCYGLETFGLNRIDNLQAQVNLANGNLVVHATDLKINGPGLSVRLDRFYNSKATGTGTFGINSVLSTGRDVGLQVGVHRPVRVHRGLPRHQHVHLAAGDQRRPDQGW